MSEEAFSPEAGQDPDGSSSRAAESGLPAAAERRLESERRQGAFTSDLSVADFALCDRLGLAPLSQVMGTCVYQIGYQAQTWGMAREMSEMATLSEAWNVSRDLAMERLAQEARELDADAVVGVDVRSSVGDWNEAGGYGAIEYVVTGTAVRRTGAGSADARAARPVITELSVADYAKLLAAGIEPAGVVAWTSVFFASTLYIRGGQPGLLGGGYSFGNFEMRELTECFYSAREQVTARIGRQARALGASGIVGVRIRHTASPGSLYTGTGTGETPGVIASFSAIGTAVHDSPGAAPQAPMPTIDMTT